MSKNEQESPGLESAYEGHLELEAVPERPTLICTQGTGTAYNHCDQQKEKNPYSVQQKIADADDEERRPRSAAILNLFVD